MVFMLNDMRWRDLLWHVISNCCHMLLLHVSSYMTWVSGLVSYYGVLFSFSWSMIARATKWYKSWNAIVLILLSAIPGVEYNIRNYQDCFLPCFIQAFVLFNTLFSTCVKVFLFSTVLKSCTFVLLAGVGCSRCNTRSRHTTA